MKIRLGRYSISLRIHQGFFANPPRSGPELDRPNYHMFVQDVAARVIPYFARRDSKGQPIADFQCDPEVLQAVYDRFAAIPSGSMGGRHRVDAEDLIQHIGERLPWTGRYQVDLRRRERAQRREQGSPVCYDKWTPKVCGVTLQIGLTNKDSREWELNVGIVPSVDVLDVRIPKSLGGIRGYRRLVARLDRFYDIGPKHWRRAIEAGRPDWTLDLATYRRASRIYRERASRDFGWDGRDTGTDFKTEYFTVYQSLRMRRACSLIRDSIVEALSTSLQVRRIEARVVVNGLPTAEDVGRAIAKLESGESTLQDAYNVVLK
jgi:hypothetical protein